MFPEVELRYRGYMLWRGLLPESELAESETLGSTVPRLSFTDAPGNLVVYFVPGQDGSLVPGERLANWASYIVLPESELNGFMVDASGTAREGTIPPGEMRPEEERRLKAMMVANLPDYYAQIIERTERTYVQLIYTVRVPAYRQGHMCLIGDAGSVAQPFTGSGVFKGHSNTTGLIAALAETDDLDAALDAWSAEQVAISDRLLALGEQMEQAFIWDSLDLAQADGQAAETWWREAVTFPEDFTYEAEE
jgi:2-polyprenyl-6-methoxyphenol hydroxylase-like FAD-dependent oxidoreductase